MNISNHVTRFVGALCGAMMFAGCTAADSEGKASAMRSPGKPLAPVEIAYTLKGEPAVGRTLEIDLVVTPRVATPTVVVEVRGQGPLDVDLGDRQQVYSVQKPGQAHRHTVHVTPTGEGMARVIVSATVEWQGRSQTRVLGIDLPVGNVQRQPSIEAEVEVDEATGERVRKLPATTKEK